MPFFMHLEQFQGANFGFSAMPPDQVSRSKGRKRGTKIHTSFKGLASNRALAHDLATWHRPARNRNRLEAVVAHKGANPVGIFSRLGLSLRGDLQEE